MWVKNVAILLFSLFLSGICVDNEQCLSNIRSQRVVVIGDVHGSLSFFNILHAAGITALPTECSWKASSEDILLVQMGDIVDRGSYAYEAWRCLEKLQQEAPDGSKVVRLIGNHELWWLEGLLHMRNKAHDTPEKINYIVSTSKEAIMDNRLVGAYPLSFGNDNEPLLFVHAGLKSGFLNHMSRFVDSLDAHSIANYINSEIKSVVSQCRSKYCRLNGELFEAGPDRGGAGIGGPFWTDFNVIHKEAESDMLTANFIQIVGHTPSHCGDARSSLDCIRYSKNFRAICVDGGMFLGGMSYMEIISDGQVISHQYQPSSKSWESKNMFTLNKSLDLLVF